MNNSAAVPSPVAKRGFVAIACNIIGVWVNFPVVISRLMQRGQVIGASVISSMSTRNKGVGFSDFG